VEEIKIPGRSPPTTEQIDALIAKYISAKNSKDQQK